MFNPVNVLIKSFLDKQTDEQTDRQADRQTDEQTDRQVGRQRNRQTESNRQNQMLHACMQGNVNPRVTCVYITTVIIVCFTYTTLTSGTVTGKIPEHEIFHGGSG